MEHQFVEGARYEMNDGRVTAPIKFFENGAKATDGNHVWHLPSGKCQPSSTPAPLDLTTKRVTVTPYTTTAPKRKVEDLGKDEVIHCPTEKEAKAVCKLFREARFYWCDGSSYKNNLEWDRNTKDTCYRPYSGSVADSEFYKEAGCTIYPASDFLPTEAPFYPVPEVGTQLTFPRKMLVWGEDQAQAREAIVLEYYSQDKPAPYRIATRSPKGEWYTGRIENAKEIEDVTTPETAHRDTEQVKANVPEVKAKTDNRYYLSKIEAQGMHEGLWHKTKEGAISAAQDKMDGACVAQIFEVNLAALVEVTRKIHVTDL